MKDYRFLLVIGFFVTLLAKGWSYIYSFNLISFLLVIMGTAITMVGLGTWIRSKKSSI